MVEVILQRLFQDGWVAAWAVAVIVLVSVLGDRLVSGKRLREERERGDNYQRAYINALETRSTSEAAINLAVEQGKTIIGLIKEGTRVIEDRLAAIPIEVVEPIRVVADPDAYAPDDRGAGDQD